MERLAEQRPRCPGCGAETGNARCDACGSALAPGGHPVEHLLSQLPHSRVYLASRPDGERVAVKELLFTLAPGTKQIDDFEREARLLASLDHPGIPRFVGHFREGEGVHLRLYNVQQYVEGTSLEEWVGSRGPVAGEDVRSLARQLLQILRYLHEREPAIVHRDVKPANVIVREGLRLSLVDFGIAREVRLGGTHGATMVGTLGYMSPEQMGGSATPRSDLYGVGATLLHALTGHHPEELLSEGLELRLPAGLEPRWRAFLSRLVARRPQDRFASAQESLEALEAWRAPSRPRVVLAVAALVVLAGVTALAVARRAAPPPPPPLASAAVAPASGTRAERLARGEQAVFHWDEALRLADSRSARLAALLLARHGGGEEAPAATQIPADLEAVVAGLARDEDLQIRWEALHLLAQAGVEGTAPLDAALEALGAAKTDAERELAANAVHAQFKDRPASAVTPARLAPVERLLFDTRASLEVRLVAKGILQGLHPLPPELLVRLRAQMLAESPSAISTRIFDILFSHYGDYPATEEEALTMSRSRDLNDRHFGVILLGKRFPYSRRAAARLRELAGQEENESVRGDAELLVKDLPAASR